MEEFRLVQIVFCIEMFLIALIAMIPIVPVSNFDVGLGYMKIVQNDENFHSFPNVKDIFAKTENSQLFESIKKLWWSSGQKVDWKGWSSLRWEESWGHFLQMKDAEADPSYQQVKALYDIVLKKMGK